MLSARLQRLKDRVLSDGGAARGAAGYRAYARMLAHAKYGAATWAQRLHAESARRDRADLDCPR